MTATKKDNTVQDAKDVQQYFQQHSVAMGSWWIRQIFRALGALAGEVAEHPGFAIWTIRAIKFVPK